MRLYSVWVACVSLCSMQILLAQAPEYQYDCVYFENSAFSENYFHSSVSYSNEGYIENVNGKLPVNEDDFFTAPNALLLNYEGGSWSAEINRARVRGMDHFKTADYLSFWINKRHTENKDLPIVSIGEKTNDTGQSEKLPIDKYLKETKNDWQRVLIPLKDFSLSTSTFISKIIFSNGSKASSGNILIDQIELLPQKNNKINSFPTTLKAKGYNLHVDISWPRIHDTAVKYVKVYRSIDSIQFNEIGIQPTYFNRYADFTNQTNTKFYYKISYLDYDYNETKSSHTISASTIEMSDEELLDMVQEASFRYYWEGAEKNSGLALENIPGRKNMIAVGASGFGIMAIVVAVERGFITRQDAVARMLKIVSFLKKSEKFHGALPHFIDGPTAKVEPFFGQWDNGGDLVETSFLFQGLLAARSYFNRKNQHEKTIRDEITALWEGVEWNWYDREKENGFLTWHWSPDQFWKVDHKLIGWNETMITYILSIASPTYPISSDMYYNGWASQNEIAKKYRQDWGKTLDGSRYSNKKYYNGIQLPVGVANGGPLFFTHYSFLGLNPHKVTDRYANYFDNNQRIALINWRYCSENPNNHRGFSNSFWGLTASDGPWGYKALEPQKDKEDGTIAPTGALASFPYTPKQSMLALKHMYRNYGKYLWGIYGFKDAINLEANWQANIYMGLNQAPIVVMIENYRTGLIWNLFMKNKEIKETLDWLDSTKEK